MQSLRYLALCLALGLIAVWASENMFWVIPPPYLRPIDLFFGWLLYSGCAAAALSAVIVTGVGGWWAAFLGGCLLGVLVEGVIVDTIYDAFPFQLVWVPLAWHGLVSGGLVLGALRAPLTGWRAVALWGGAGVAWLFWSLFWASERAVLPGTGTLLVYLALPAVAVIGAHRVIDRLGPPPRPSVWVLSVAPGLLGALWLWKLVTLPLPQKAALPLMIAGLVWLMRRCGPGGVGHAGPPWRAAPVLIPPVMVAFLAPPLWAAFGGIAGHAVLAIVTGLVALGLIGWASFTRAPPAPPPGQSPRHRAPAH